MNSINDFDLISTNSSNFHEILLIPKMFTPITYSGSSHNKQVIYNNKVYMVKYSKTRSNKISNDFTIHWQTELTEYIASKLFSRFGMLTQNVLIGYDTFAQELCVMCEDFCDGKNLIILSDKSSMSELELRQQRNTIHNNDYVNKLVDRLDIDKKIFEDYWMSLLVLDFLVGNRDRHLGNIGFLYDRQTNSLTISPTFDNGASLGCHIHVDSGYTYHNPLPEALMNTTLYQNMNGVRVSTKSIIEHKLPKTFYNKLNDMLGNFEEAPFQDIFFDTLKFTKLSDHQKSHVHLGLVCYIHNFTILKEALNGS